MPSYAHRGEEHTIQEQVYKAFDEKYAIRLAEKDRIGGKNLIHEFLVGCKDLDCHEAVSYNPDHAVWVLRNKGEQAYNEYLSLFVEPESEHNLPKLLIFSHTTKAGNRKK
jgi:hypothetical protein